MRSMFPCLALVLAGCASYGEVVESGYRYEWESPKSPVALARCVTVNAEREQPWVVTQRLVSDDGRIELVIRPGDGRIVTAVVQTTPALAGSAVKAWITPEAPLSKDRFAALFFEGC